MKSGLIASQVVVGQMGNTLPEKPSGFEDWTWWNRNEMNAFGSETDETCTVGVCGLGLGKLNGEETTRTGERLDQPS